MTDNASGSELASTASTVAEGAHEAAAFAGHALGGLRGASAVSAQALAKGTAVNGAALSAAKQAEMKWGSHTSANDNHHLHPAKKPEVVGGAEVKSPAPTKANLPPTQLGSATRYDAPAAALGSAQGLVNLVFLTQFIGMPLRWIADKVKANTLKLAINTAIFAPIQAMDEVKMSEVHRLPGEALKQAHDLAMEVGGSRAERFGKWALGVSERLGNRLGRADTAAMSGFTRLASKFTVFQGVAIGASALGIGAILFRALGTHSKTVVGYNEILSDLGETPYADAIRTHMSHMKRGQGWNAAAGAAGEAVNGALMGLPASVAGAGDIFGKRQMGIMAAMGLSSTLPNVIGVAGDPFLEACTALSMAERGQMSLTPAQKLDAIKQLLGVASHDGIYNSHVTPGAAEILNRNLSFKDTLKLINNPSEMAKIEAMVAAKAAAPVAETAVAAHVSTKAEAAYAAAEKPGAPVTDKYHRGVVNGHELSLV
jgi:hypothetical protein